MSLSLAIRAALPRSRTAGVLYAAALSVLLVLAQEPAVRLAMPQFDPSQNLRFELDPATGLILGPRDGRFRQIKNTGDFDVDVRFNAHGLRDDQDVARGQEEDLYLVGDSFAFGWGVAEADRASEQLAGLAGRTVYNVAMTGDFDAYGQLLGYARALGATVRHVVVMVTMENDLHVYRRDDAPAGTTDPMPPAAASEAAGPSPLLRLKVWLTQRSALYTLVVSVIHQVPLLESLFVRAGLIRPNLEGIHLPETSPEAIRTSAERLARLARDYDTTVAIIPSRALWHGEHRAEAARSHDAFVAALRALGVAVVDLRPVFEAEGRPLDHHFANDGHWRPVGHRRAAEAIAARLGGAAPAAR